MTLFQPVFVYDKDVFGEIKRRSFNSAIVYRTKKQANLCALDDWNNIKSDEDTLINITIRQLVIG